MRISGLNNLQKRKFEMRNRFIYFKQNGSTYGEHKTKYTLQND